MESHRLTSEDLAALLETVQRFAQRSLADATAAPHQPMPPATTAALVGQLLDMGVLNATEEPACGLWDDPQDPLQVEFALHALQTLAHQSPGFAYQVHVQALANQLSRSTGAPTGPDLVVLEGWLGLGRRALPGTLLGTVSGAATSPEDAARMADCWCLPTADKPRTVVALPDWSTVWIPTWQADEGWCWHRLARTDLVVQMQAHAHGLDELVPQRISLRAGVVPPAADICAADESSLHFLALSGLYGMGLLAIATGAARRALAIATDYAAMRRQGGPLIQEHDAVAQLLGEARQSVRLADIALASTTQPTTSLALLADIWQLRAALHPLLCTAASQALQVLGGIGYMRDQGVEKLLRDCNQLRLLGGSPQELTLCSAQKELLV